MIAVLLALAASPIFIDAAAAKDLRAEILDARGDKARPPYLPGARVIEWKDTRYGVGAMGRLDDDLDRVRAVLERAGVTGTKPILIYGAADEAWGEEGRIWWTLKYLGFDDIHILDGGIRGWTFATADKPEPPAAEKNTLAFHPRAELRADWIKVRDHRGAILDVRTREEFAGATLFGESKGGHVPRAKHLEWKTLIDPKTGRVRAREEIIAELHRVGVGRNDPVVTYCTGGVRSAFVQAVLLDAGFRQVANYDGSWFDWSSRPKLPVEK